MLTTLFTPAHSLYGTLHCPRCGGSTPCLRTHAISARNPAFYCDRCPNIMQRQSDHDHLASHPLTEGTIAFLLARHQPCPCGGRFTHDAQPRCSGCKRPILDTPRARECLLDPRLIIPDGATVFGDGEPERFRFALAPR